MDCDGVLTDGGVYYSKNGEEMLKFNRRDGKGIELLHENNIATAIISSENSDIIRKRAEKLKIENVFTGVGRKTEILDLLVEKMSISKEEVAYIGDDIGDLDVMKSVGFPVAVSDAVEEVINIAHYVCAKKGGDSSVREFIDILIKAKYENR